jgi:GNAT superfamily N-acetyltransferase
MKQVINIQHGEYLITTDKSLMQPEAIHKWLSEKSYWVQNIPLEVVKNAFDNSFCIAVLKDGLQVGYARFVTDYATVAWLGDVYIEEEHRGKGLSKKMMEVLTGIDWVQKLRKLFLGTLDAHGLYAQYGFEPVSEPGRWMELTRANIYKQQ